MISKMKRELTVDTAEVRAADARSGRAVWDDRGNSTWEWQTGPGVFSRDIDTQQLKVLIPDFLQIDERYASGARGRRR